MGSLRPSFTSRDTTTSILSCNWHSAAQRREAAYNHALYLEPRAKMMQDWADFLERTQRGGKVLPFRSSAAFSKHYNAADGRPAPSTL